MEPLTEDTDAPTTGQTTAVFATTMEDDDPAEEPMHAGLLPMIFQLMHDRPTGSTNDALVDHLKGSGSIVDDKIEAAFRAVDRAKFIPNITRSSPYDDSPVRSGHFHMSQPSLYADALAALDVLPGSSFLNIGSGTGYLSSIVAELAGPSLHHGVDVHEDVLRHAEEMFKVQGKEYIRCFHVNAHDLDIKCSPRYQRIYLGACAGGESKRLLELLEIGGILVGPFATASGQYIRRVLRRSATVYEVKNLKSVQFGTLLPSTDPCAEKFGLPHPVWTPESHAKYGRTFRKALLEILFSTTREESPTNILPRDVFIKHVFPFIHPRWFDEIATGSCTEVLENGCEREMGNEGDFDEERMHLRTLRTLALIANGRAPIGGGPGGPALQHLIHILGNRSTVGTQSDSEAEESDDPGHAPGIVASSQSPRSLNEYEALHEDAGHADHEEAMEEATEEVARAARAPPRSSSTATGRASTSRGCQAF